MIKRALYSLLLAIGLRRIGEALIKIATSDKAKDFVADAIHTGVNRTLYGNEAAQQRLRRRTRDRSRPYDHKVHGL